MLANFRFYAELNDFLDAAQQGRSLGYRFDGNPAIKDPIETLGVPHSEVDLIIVDGRSVGFISARALTAPIISFQ